MNRGNGIVGLGAIQAEVDAVEVSVAQVVLDLANTDANVANCIVDPGASANGEVLTIVNDVPSWEPASAAGAFTDLSDAPASYAGANSKIVAVKSDASGLEFIDRTDLESAVLGADQAITSDALTDANGVAITLTSGTWLILADACLTTAAGGGAYGLMILADVTASNAAISASKSSMASGAAAHLHCSAVVTITASNDYKMQCQSNSATINKQGDNAGQRLTQLKAIKLA